MGLDYTFHIEHFYQGVWQVPANHQVRSQYSLPGDFLWLSGSHPIRDLCFSETALLPFTPGPPPDWHSSQLYQWFNNGNDFEQNEWQISWTPFENLMIDSWQTEKVMITGRTTVNSAPLFGDGAQPFPAFELLALGMTELELSSIRRGKLTDQPIDRLYGPARYELDKLPPDYTVPVTWIETIASWMGDIVLESFLKLRHYGQDQDLRIISMLI